MVAYFQNIRCKQKTIKRVVYAICFAVARVFSLMNSTLTNSRNNLDVKKKKKR